MTISVLDRISNADQPTLGDLHDEAGKVDETGLPCRVNNPELWFAESPSDVEYAKALCIDCPVRALCLDGALERDLVAGMGHGDADAWHLLRRRNQALVLLMGASFDAFGSVRHGHPLWLG